MSLVVPAILPSSRKELEEKLAVLSTIHSLSRVQIDVVDGRFASPASWPYTTAHELREAVKEKKMFPYLNHIEYEIDLMCLNPERVAGMWLALGASRLTLHIESTTNLTHLLKTVHALHGRDVVAYGLALNITSDLALIEPHLKETDYVQFMGIAKIGQQGQPFERRVFEKIRTFHARHPEVTLQIDGGVSLKNAERLISLGISNLVIGSAILRTADPRAEVKKFEALQNPYGV